MDVARRSALSNVLPGRVPSPHRAPPGHRHPRRIQSRGRRSMPGVLRPPRRAVLPRALPGARRNRPAELRRPQPAERPRPPAAALNPSRAQLRATAAGDPAGRAGRRRSRDRSFASTSGCAAAYSMRPACAAGSAAGASCSSPSGRPRSRWRATAEERARPGPLAGLAVTTEPREASELAACGRRSGHPCPTRGGSRPRPEVESLARGVGSRRPAAGAALRRRLRAAAGASRRPDARGQGAARPRSAARGGDDPGAQRRAQAPVAAEGGRARARGRRPRASWRWRSPTSWATTSRRSARAPRLPIRRRFARSARCAGAPRRARRGPAAPCASTSRRRARRAARDAEARTTAVPARRDARRWAAAG